MKKKIIPIVVAAVIISIVAIILIKRSEFYYAGTVEATEVDLSARITGTIASVAVQEGEQVARGQELVKLAIEDVEVAANQSEREYKRAQELLRAGSMNQDAYDKIKFKRDDLAVKLSWGSIKAPCDGVVLNRYHEPGELVNPGTKLLTVANLKTVWAYIYVEQPMLSRLKLGQEITGMVPDSDIKKITGKVIHIKDEAEFTPKNVQTRSERTRLVYGIKIEFDNAQGRLKPGMTVEVAF